MATITEDHFGSNIILTRDSIAEGSAFREVLAETSFSHFRYPGGGITEAQTWENGGLDRMFGAPMSPGAEDHVMTIREALSFAGGYGTELTIVIPTFQFLDRETGGFRQAEFDRYLSELEGALSDFAHVPIRVFEIGNEYWGSKEFGAMTAEEYGMIANSEIMAVHVMSERIAAQHPDWDLPGIGIQAGAAWRASGGDESHRIASMIGPEERALVETIFQHSYPDLDKVQTGWQQDLAVDPMHAYAEIDGFRDDLKLSMSEFNVGGQETTGVSQAAGWIEELSSHVEKGIDEVQHWGISYKWLSNKFYDTQFPPAEADTGDIVVKATPLGQVHDLAEANIIGKETMQDAQATERLALEGQFGVTGFRDAGQRVIFIHNQGDDAGRVDLSHVPEGWHVAAHHLKDADSPHTSWLDESYPSPPASGEIADARGDMHVKSGEAAPVFLEVGAGDMAVVIASEAGRDLTIEGAHNVTDHRTGMVNDSIHGAEGNDILRGHVGDDTLSGAGGRNVLSGGKGADLLLAGDNGDVLLADGGSDTVMGGAGDDVILAVNGGDGDRVDITMGEGRDIVHVLTDQEVVIRDFSDENQIGLAGAFDSAEDLRDASRDVDGDLVIDLPNGGLIRLAGEAARLETLHQNVSDLNEEPDARIDQDDAAAMHAPGFFEGLSYDQVMEIYDGVAVAEGEGAAEQLGWGDVDETLDFLDAAPSQSAQYDPAAPDPWNVQTGTDEPEPLNDEEEEEQNPDDASGGGCFVATAAYGDRMHPDVVALRHFRDRHLIRTRAGRGLVRIYWRIGPPLARVTSPQSPHGTLTRLAISRMVKLLERRGLA